jgi:hypothetical protein
MQQSLLFTLHVCTTMGHLQVFSFVFSYTSFTIELQREIHTYLLTYIVHKLLHSLLFTPYLGILTSVGPLYQPNNKVEIAF